MKSTMAILFLFSGHVETINYPTVAMCAEAREIILAQSREQGRREDDVFVVCIPKPKYTPQ